MILLDVLAELAEGLRVIEGLEVVQYLPDTVSPPTAIVAYPDDGDFDVTYGRGYDSFDLPIVVAMGDVYGPQTVVDVSGYVSGTGPRSIKAAIDAITSPSSFDVAQVNRFEIEPLSFNNVPLLSAIFGVTIIGSGTVT